MGCADQFSKNRFLITLAFLAAIALSFLDVATTTYAISIGAQELNPFMVDKPLIPMKIIALILVGFLAYLGERFMSKGYIAPATFAGFTILPVVNNVLWIYGVI